MELYQMSKVTMASPAILKVIEYIQLHDLSVLSTGIHEVSEDFFFNLIEYNSTTPDNRVWESHRTYLDIHVPLIGEELIYHNFVENMKVTGYIEDEDWVQQDGMFSSQMVVSPGDILLLDQEDSHKTGLSNGENKFIRKAVFKVKI